MEDSPETQVFEFIWNDCIHESAFCTMSLHRTKKGAYKAMRTYLETEYALWRKSGIECGRQHFKFGMYCAWAINSTTMQE